MKKNCGKTNPGQLVLFEELLPQKKQDSCVPPHIRNPRTDNDKLLNYQYDYLCNGNTQALAEIYNMSVLVCQKLIATEHKRKGFYIDHDLFEEKAHAAAAYVICQYLETKSFVIEKSFIGYLYLRVQHELYYRTAADTLVSFVDADDLRMLDKCIDVHECPCCHHVIEINEVICRHCGIQLEVL